MMGVVSGLASSLAGATTFGSREPLESYGHHYYGRLSIKQYSFGGYRFLSQGIRARHQHEFVREFEHENEHGHDHEHEHVGGVPEPGTWAMLLVGAGLVGYQLRRKQRALGSRAA